MNGKLAKDAGENYEYIRTIIENRLELARINSAETMAKLTGQLILLALILFVGMSIITGLLIVFTILMYNVFTSWVLGILTTLALICLIGGLLIAFRKAIIINPIQKLILYSILQDDK